MKLLAFDTAMAACSVAVVDTERVVPLASAWVAMDRGHAEALAPMIAGAMSEACVGFDELDRVAVTTGPGTFTGVRIGLAMARGLGLALEIPVTGLSTLAVIAGNAAAHRRPVLVAAEARNGEAYTALFDAEGLQLRAPAVVAIARVAAFAPAHALVVGTAADAVIGQGEAARLERSHDGDLPVAACLARLAALSPPSTAMPVPLYLRAPDAKPQAKPARHIPAFTFHAMTLPDASVMAAIHEECFDKPWSAAELAGLLAMPGAAAILVAESGAPVAFGLFRQAADEAEIITIATRPEARRRGAARALLAHQLASLAAGGTAAAFLEVAASNLAARSLYAACGFVEAGRRANYYALGGGRHEDAIVMHKDLMQKDLAHREFPT